MNVLITGGAGFIGSHLSESLLKNADTRIVALDDLSTGSRANLVPFEKTGRLEFIEGSIGDAPLVKQLVSASDVVYHLAAAVGVRRVLERPLETLESNVLGTHAVLGACAEKGTPVLLASTSEVYGKSSAIPFREDGDSVLGASGKSRWSYACSKMLDEFWALAYRREMGLPVVIARLFNTVGPRQTGRYGMVVPNFVRQALHGVPLTVHGDGTQSRCFTHVRDAVRCLEALVATPEAYGEVVNVGGQQEISIGGLAQRVIDLTGSPSPVQMVPYEQAFECSLGFEDMKRRVPDTAKLRSLVGFAPETSTDQILHDVIEDMRTTLK